MIEDQRRTIIGSLSISTSAVGFFVVFRATVFFTGAFSTCSSANGFSLFFDDCAFFVVEGFGAVVRATGALARVDLVVVAGAGAAFVLDDALVAVLGLSVMVDDVKEQEPVSREGHVVDIPFADNSVKFLSTLFNQ